MAYIQISSIDKINELKNTDEFFIIVDGKEYLVTLQTLSDVFGNSPELIQNINAEIEALRSIVDAFPSENPAAPKALKISDTPTIDGIFKPTEVGTYTNAGGLIYNPTEGITYFIRTSGVWTKDVTPVNFTPTGVVEQGNTNAVSGGEVFESTIQKDSTKILDSDKDFVKIERPDLQRFVIVDSNDVIIHETADLKELKELEKRVLPDNAESIDSSYDRPDLPGLVILDKNNNILEKKENNFSLESTVNRTNIVDDLQGFSLVDEVFIPDNLYSEWDNLINEFPNYITKSEIGRTSIKNMPIYAYKFSIHNATKRLLIISGAHASEKVYQKINLDFANKLCRDFVNNDLLTYLRTSVELHFIPLLCPANALGLDNSITGGRRCAETEPIDVTWTKVGNVVTLTYDVSNFPSSNPNVSGSNYFDLSPIGKLAITIFNSNDTVLLPDNGYELKTIISGNTITIQSPNTTNGSGTAKMLVYTDPNRNINVSYEIWKNQSVSKVLSQYPSDYGKSFHSNMGTRPNSLREISSLMNYIDNNNIDLLIDAHSGAGTNYINLPYSYSYMNLENTLNYTTNIVKATSNYPLHDLYEEAEYYRFSEVNGARFSNYMIFNKDKIGLTIEWTNPNEMDIQNSSQSYNLLTNSINLLTNLIHK